MAPMGANALRYAGIGTILGFSLLGMLLHTIDKETPAGGDGVSSIPAWPSFFEDRFLDWRKGLAARRGRARGAGDVGGGADGGIVVLRIDDESLERIGRWPWSRRVWARVVDRAAHFGARTLAFDVLFSEPERACPGEGSADLALAEAFRRFLAADGRGIALPYSMNISGRRRAGDFDEIPDELHDVVLDARSPRGAAPLGEGFARRDVHPLGELLVPGVGLGFIQARADRDGVFRRHHLVAAAEGVHLPSLALLAHRLHGGGRATLVLAPPGGQSLLATARGDLPVNPDGTVAVDWSGGADAFPSVAVHELLAAPDDDPSMRGLLQDALALVGSTAFGAHDFRNTPVDAQLPGVYAHANVIRMLRRGSHFKPHDLSTQLSWAVLAACVLAVALAGLARSPVADAAVLMGLAAGLVALDHWVLLPRGYETRLFFCLVSLAGCYSWITFLNVRESNRDKRFLARAFGAYLSPKVIGRMQRSGERPRLGGESGVRTAFFSDVEGFSAIAEKLPPTELVGLLNEYLTAMTDVLLEEEGTLDKYEGDAVVAFFGAPAPLADHARRACRAAVRMRERLAGLRRKWRAEGRAWPAEAMGMRMRVGINTGEMVTGNMGSAQRMNYTMMGDAVNVAARLESAASLYGAGVHVSARTREEAGEGFLWRELDVARVVGRGRPVAAWELLGFADGAPDDLARLASRFGEGVRLYRKGRFAPAGDVFAETLELEPARAGTNPSGVFLARCRALAESPPEDWDGVWTLREK